MEEIRSLPPNGLTVASLFSGGGGSSLGYEMAGFDVRYANEFVPAARDTYRANFPGTFVDERDIREVEGADVLEALGMRAGELDVLDGSPPCASFSTAGKREAGWGKVKKYSDVEQRTDDLFFEYARILGDVQPKVFVAENVAGLVKGSAKGYFKEILAALKSKGYRVRAAVLDAQWLGVPQARRRVIFVGVREDLKAAPAHPKPFAHQYSVREAIPWIFRQAAPMPYGESGMRDAARHASPTIRASPKTGNGRSPASLVEAGVVKDFHDTSGEWSTGDVTDRPCPAITVGLDGLNSQHFKVVQKYAGKFGAGPVDVTDRPAATVRCGPLISIERRPETALAPSLAREWDRTKVGEASEKYFSLVKPDPDKPCPTATQKAGAGAAGIVHPVEKRKFTIQELKRICSFPDDFVLTGTYAQQWERCGRAVPPLMMRAIAETIRDEIFAKL